MIVSFGPAFASRTYDVCVVGAGPVGIALALELARHGKSVLQLESGGTAPNTRVQAMADAAIDHPDWHVPMAIGVQRSLGGAGNLWGGRCVAYDPVDFTERPGFDLPGWPIGPDDLAPSAERGAHYADIARPEFQRAIEGLTIADPDFTADHLERWSIEPRPQVAHARAIAEAKTLDLCLGVTLAGLDIDSAGQVTAATVQTEDGTRHTIRATRFVLACGGVENARLLLNVEAAHATPNRFGGPDGMLGRGYMGHLYGSVAEVVFASETLDAALDYTSAGQGVYVRRRFNPSEALQAREGLLNVALWPEFPAIWDASHRNGVLSTAYLALSIPPLGRKLVAESIRRNYVGSGPLNLWAHLRNVLLDLPATSVFIPRFLYRRKIARPRQPGFFQRNAARRYALRFHAETRPDPNNRITLDDARDDVGLRRARITLAYRRDDVADLLRAHDLFADWLTRTGLGRMSYARPAEQRIDHILAQAYDGHHQIGTTRMAESAADGVVDRNCRVFGTQNLYVAGASVLPTSSQANPTYTAITLAVRLAAHLVSVHSDLEWRV